MNDLRFMLIAGEASGDLLAAELVRAIRAQLPAPAGNAQQFFGAGGPRMAEAGVELAFDMTQHAVVGLVEVLRNYGKFKRLFRQLLDLTGPRRPDAIICVDFSGFNRRFATAVRRYQRAHPDPKWNPKIIQYVSPQVWASRPRRAEMMARHIDLLLAIFPFEKDWYARRAPNLRVEFVGHPMVDRYGKEKAIKMAVGQNHVQAESHASEKPILPLVLLLPGSRSGELARHVPVMLRAAERIAQRDAARFRMVLPNDSRTRQAQDLVKAHAQLGLEVQVGNLPESLQKATIAIASTGTVTMECAYFGVPTVAIYKTSWSTYQIGKRVVSVKFLAMPNLLADELIYPEFIQNEATAENISRAALELLNDAEKRELAKAKLSRIVKSLGGPGANERAARSVLELLRVG